MSSLSLIVQKYYYHNLVLIVSGILIYSTFIISVYLYKLSSIIFLISWQKNPLFFHHGAFDMLQYLKINSILTFPVTLATPSFSCERSADEKLPEASERRRKIKCLPWFIWPNNHEYYCKEKISNKLQPYQINRKVISMHSK